MRGQLATGIGLTAAAAVGAALVATGAVTGADVPYRAGVGVLLVSLACLVMHTARCNTARLMGHQAEMAHMNRAQRQKWSEYGYRAGELDAQGHFMQQGNAQVLDLPHADVRQHRNGA